MPAGPHPNQRDPATLPVELRRPTVPPAVRAWVARQTGATVQRAVRLPGASSTAVHGLHLSDGRRVVLRRYVWPGFLEDEPIAPRRELDALRFARRHRLPVPEVVAADLEGVSVGDGVAVLLMTHVPGRAVAVPDLRRLADLAAAIHAVAADDLGHDYFPWYTSAVSAPPAATTRPQLWATALDVWHNHMPPFRPSLIHRDFHPGNVHWSRGQPTGIVDWASACRGPWGCDVAHCRANLIDLSGLDAADAFLAAYEAATGEVYDPFWELASVLEHRPSHWTAPTLAMSEPRLEWALRRL